MNQNKKRACQKKNWFLGKVFLCFISVYFIFFFITKGMEVSKKNIQFDPLEYTYNCEIAGSPLHSPDKRKMLNLKLAFNAPTGGNAYLFGNVTNEDGSGGKIIYLDRCVVFRSPSDGSITFRYVEEPTFSWKSSTIVIINGHEIDVQKNESYKGELFNIIFD